MANKAVVRNEAPMQLSEHTYPPGTKYIWDVKLTAQGLHITQRGGRDMPVTMYLLCIVLRVIMIPWKVIIHDCALKGTTRKLAEVYLDGSVKHKAEAGVKASITNDQVASKKNRQQK